MKHACIICVAFAAVGTPPAVSADEAAVATALEAAIADYRACNRAAVATVEERPRRSSGWRAAYAEGRCLHALEPVNELMLELHVPEVTFYKIQGLRTRMLRENMEQIHTAEKP